MKENRQKVEANRNKAADLRRRATEKLKVVKEELRVRTLMLEQREVDNLEKMSTLQSLSAAMRMMSITNVNPKDVERELKDSEKELQDATEFLSNLSTMESYIRNLVL